MNYFPEVKILIIDDDNDFRISCIEYFTGKKYKISGAENGKVALNMMSLVHYDIVLLDLNMPVMDGLQTMKEIKRLNRDTHIYIISGERNAQKSYYYNSGCVLFEKKPVDIVELEMKIRNIIGLLEKSKTKNIPQNNYIDREINLIYDFIILNVDNYNLNVHLISEALDLSVNYIYSKFQNILTVSLHDTIKNIRLLRANSIIRTRFVRTIQELSESSGYKDSGYFARMYKNAFGVDLFEDIKSHRMRINQKSGN
jgi:YesN/AraC family two-component response regulator